MSVTLIVYKSSSKLAPCDFKLRFKPPFLCATFNVDFRLESKNSILTIIVVIEKSKTLKCPDIQINIPIYTVFVKVSSVYRVVYF